jgi:hypothetical protein
MPQGKDTFVPVLKAPSPEHARMCGGMAPYILTSPLDAGERSASHISTPVPLQSRSGRRGMDRWVTTTWNPNRRPSLYWATATPLRPIMSYSITSGSHINLPDCTSPAQGNILPSPVCTLLHKHTAYFGGQIRDDVLDNTYNTMEQKKKFIYSIILCRKSEVKRPLEWLSRRRDGIRVVFVFTCAEHVVGSRDHTDGTSGSWQVSSFRMSWAAGSLHSSQPSTSCEKPDPRRHRYWKVTSTSTSHVCIAYFRRNVSVISGSLLTRYGATSGCGRRNGLKLWREAANILSCRGQPTRGYPPAWGLGEMLTTSHRKD